MNWDQNTDVLEKALKEEILDKGGCGCVNYNLMFAGTFSIRQGDGWGGPDSYSDGSQIMAEVVPVRRLINK